MVKFFALIALVACVAGASADAEDAKLSYDEMQLFEPYCLKAVDYREGEIDKNSAEIPKDVMFTLLHAGEAADYNEELYADKIINSIESIKEEFGQEKANELFAKACDAVSKYEAPLRDMFEVAKTEIVANHPELARITFETVGCLTTRRVLRTREICQTAKSSQKPMDEVLVSLFDQEPRESA